MGRQGQSTQGSAWQSSDVEASACPHLSLSATASDVDTGCPCVLLGSPTSVLACLCPRRSGLRSSSKTQSPSCPCLVQATFAGIRAGKWRLLYSQRLGSPWALGSGVFSQSVWSSLKVRIISPFFSKDELHLILATVSFLLFLFSYSFIPFLPPSQYLGQDFRPHLCNSRDELCSKTPLCQPHSLQACRRTYC